MTNKEVGLLRQENENLRRLCILLIKDRTNLFPGETAEDRLEYLLEIIQEEAYTRQRRSKVW